MTLAQALALLAQYRAGLEAEMAILRKIGALAERQREATRTSRTDVLQSVIDDRDRLITTLVSLEHDLDPVRRQLAAQRERLAGTTAFQDAAALHRQAASLVDTILAVDRESIERLQAAEVAHRAATRALEQGEHTLAAYRRVVTPPLTPATLIVRKG